ncbi:MAG: efflux transporter periplasmic adaptor subunit, partial [Herbinix sp.]|nr:efflux transporter periplasmic adaptor subunit [Herbinix sp.]
DIIIEEAENCIAIPSDALMRNNVVYVKDDTVTEAVGNIPAGFKEVAVETGITDGDYVEVTSGLTGTEEVYVQRAISSEAATEEGSLLDGLGLGGNSNSGMPAGGGNMNRGNFNGGGNMGGGMGAPGQ